MVDALREAHRVLAASGVLIDVRPLIEPIVVEVVSGNRALWSESLALYSTPEDILAADAAMKHAFSHDWFNFKASLTFSFDIYCDTADDLKSYADGRKLVGAEIPYAEVEERRRKSGARLRCRRPWMLTTYRKI